MGESTMNFHEVESTCASNSATSMQFKTPGEYAAAKEALQLTGEGSKWQRPDTLFTINLYCRGYHTIRIEINVLWNLSEYSLRCQSGVARWHPFQVDFIAGL